MKLSRFEPWIARVAAACFALMVGMGGPSWAQADDWPMFRGNPSLTGVSTNHFPDKLTKLWEFKTGGPVKSSPAIVNGKVYVGSLDQKIYALDLRAGAKEWEFKTEGGVESSPLVLDGRVYAGSEDSHLYSLSAKTGEGFDAWIEWLTEKVTKK